MYNQQQREDIQYTGQLLYDDHGESIVAHYDSILLAEANAETIFPGIDSCISHNGILCHIGFIR